MPHNDKQTNTMKNMTIYDIKRMTEGTSPYFFTRKTLKFFGQTMRMFSVKKQTDGRYYISCPMFDRFTGKQIGMTERYYNPVNNELERN